MVEAITKPDCILEINFSKDLTGQKKSRLLDPDCDLYKILSQIAEKNKLIGHSARMDLHIELIKAGEFNQSTFIDLRNQREKELTG